MGPTDSNHLYWLSAWLDPAGEAGGPLLATSSASCLNSKSGDQSAARARSRGARCPRSSRSTASRGSSTARATSAPFGFTPYFAKYQNTPGITNPYYTQGVLPTFEDFLNDAANGRLPAVSWVLTDFDKSEHASYSPQAGIQQVRTRIAALTTLPDRWASTVLFLTYDENGGFFDHVAPPMPPAGTPGEFITSTKPATMCLPLPSEDQRDAPIGLGFRVPMMVVSPYSRGGFVCSDTFDHTSMLRFIETRYATSGVRVPNLTSWRRGVTGDLTSALDLKRSELPVPPLPGTMVDNCSTVPVSIPQPQVMPVPPDKT